MDFTRIANAADTFRPVFPEPRLLFSTSATLLKALELILSPDAEPDVVHELWLSQKPTESTIDVAKTRNDYRKRKRSAWLYSGRKQTKREKDAMLRHIHNDPTPVGSRPAREKRKNNKKKTHLMTRDFSSGLGFLANSGSRYYVHHRTLPTSSESLVVAGVANMIPRTQVGRKPSSFRVWSLVEEWGAAGVKAPGMTTMRESGRREGTNCAVARNS